MKLTKAQRHSAYIIMLHELETTETNWLCSIFYKVFGINLDHDGAYTQFKETLPELWQHRDDGRNEYSTFLFDGKTKRMDALKKCIKETSNFQS